MQKCHGGAGFSTAHLRARKGWASMSDSGLGLFYVEFSTPLCVNGAQSCTINTALCKWRQYYIKEINSVDYENYPVY